MRTQTKLGLGFATIFTLGIWVALLAGAALCEMRRDGRVVTSCCGEITTTNVAVLWSVGEGPVTTWEYGQNLGGSVTKPASN